MTTDNEPRALGAALSAPAFITRGYSVAMHAANRHVERWAPEAEAGRVRSMRSLGFVDRLVAPWMETAQRSASMRLFSQYARAGLGEREPGAVSWVFPRPWYQDELDWMAAARQATTQAALRQAAPALLTTRGTYVPAAPAAPSSIPALAAPSSLASSLPSASASSRAPFAGPRSLAAPPLAMPSALYEYVAPSLSLASSQRAPIAGVGFGGEALSRGDVYSPLISLAAVQAADLMSRTVAPLAAPHRGTSTPTAMTPGLRSVLTSILERAAAPRAAGAQSTGPGSPAGSLLTSRLSSPLAQAASASTGVPAVTRLAMSAPELVTPPSPRESELPGNAGDETAAAASASATRVAEQYAEQRMRVVELQRIAQQSAQRELTARAEAAARTQAGDPVSSTAAAGRGTTSGAATVARAAEAAAAAQAATGSQAATAPQAATAQAATTAEVRAQAVRAEAELRQRASATRAAEVQRQADAAQEAAAERARIEERVAQRLAERTASPRLHDQARAEAAAHARTPIEPARGSSAATTATAAPRAPAEVTAAIAGLPPELAAILGSAVTRRPERALQAISELNETLRTVELLARSSATGAAFEATRGPRLMMPAGLGGLVNAVDRAPMIADRAVLLGGARPLAPLSLGGQASQPSQSPPSPGLLWSRRPALEGRVPALPWLSDAPRPQAIAPSSALGATATTSPAALSHVAWADRWLARFAGAGAQSLDVISAAAAASPSTRMTALANAAPGGVFVAPDFLRGDLGAEQAARFDPEGRPLVPFVGPSSAPAAVAAPGPTPGAGVPGMRLINSAGPAGSAASEPLRRFDDAAETPDDVFAAISAAASRGRVSPSRSAAGSTARTASAAPASSTTQGAARPTLADLVAHSAPAAPGAGLSAQLASSPFAPALRHVLPLPSAASFDIRSLFGAGLGATYLAGLIGSASRELEIGAQLAPAWAAWAEAPASLGLGGPDRPDRIDRLVPTFDAAYVSPEAPGALEDRDPQGREAPGVRDALAVHGERTGELATSAPAVRAAQAAQLAGERSTNLPLTTLRTALLSWELTTAGTPGVEPGAQAFAPASFMSGSPSASTYRDGASPSGTMARTMIEGMRLPMLGEMAGDPSAQASGWAAPGMIAERAHTWSVAQERSSSDLAFDFVTPELVLAARVYGLGPAEAAQAARLAIAGPSQLGAMASTVDRTFIEAMAIDAEHRQRVAAAGPSEARTGVSPRDAASSAATTAGTPGMTGAPSLTGAPALPSEARAAITTAFPTPSGDIAAAVAPTTHVPRSPASSGGSFATSFGTSFAASLGASFGIGRRTPRGAFLWPSATVAALGMTAAGSDGQASIPVAALELLAAQVVAELGTFTALSEVEAATRGDAGDAGAASGPLGAGLAGAEPERGASPARAGALVGAAPSALVERRDSSEAGSGAEPGEADVLGAAAALVPASRRARFDALYVALSQSSAGKGWSPAARAARALALAGRGEDTAITARERAATAWDVLPVVYPSEGRAPAARAATAGYASAAAALSSYAAPSGFGSLGAGEARGPGGAPAGSPAPAGRAGTPRTRRDAGGRELVSPDAPGSGYTSGAGTESPWVHVSPGLAGLSARAGEALGAYVTPAAPPAAPPERPAQEAARPRRSGGRYGGGEPEIPPWFEAAARKMLAERSGDAGGISLAELTLVTAAPASHIAASTRSAPSSAPPGPSSAKAQHSNTPNIDVEKLANEVYRSILVLMDVARARNGDSYL